MRTSITGVMTIGIVVAGVGGALWATSTLAADEKQPPTWQYVVPKPGEPFEHPPLRALALSDQRPEDLKEEVTYRGKKRRYGQIRYGSPSSVRVAVVVDEIAPGEVDLYVDAKRSRII